MNHAHTYTTDDVLKALETSSRGLDHAEVQARAGQYGPNRLPMAPKESAFRRFFHQCNNVLIYMLIAAATITALLGEWIDASVIMGVVVLNALIGFIQEGKAADALSAIKAMLSQQAMVVRAGQQHVIDAIDLVPGDIVLLQAGDKIPADIRWLSVSAIQVQEAALTGESLPVVKHTAPVDADAELADRHCMGYSGTTISHGQGSGVVVATGGATEIGGISRLVSEVAPLSTPLIRQINRFANTLTGVTLAVAFITSLVGIWVWQYSLAEMFLAAVSLAVAAIPESLPAIVTITLAVGVQRMAKRQAIIRRLPAVETLGAVSVICTDKTGTLTRNEMTLKQIIQGRNHFTLSGTGYDPHGLISQHGAALNAQQHAAVTTLLSASSLCNDAVLRFKDDQWDVQGDPMEGAILVAAQKIGIDTDTLSRQCPRVDLIPFDAAHKYMATLHHDHNGTGIIYIKGAPEALLNVCDTALQGETYTPIDRAYWYQQIEYLASQGQRVLAVAQKASLPEQAQLRFDQTHDGFALLGLVGFIDPPREEAIAAIQACQRAGINVKMITGDHATTALAIGRQLGLKRTEKAMNGQWLSALTETELDDQIIDVDVFARVNPEHKLRLVEALQRQGFIVAMTGDGVNDAPALKRADVGTAMGKGGTEAAKEAADMVLIDDNFATITHAIREGRIIYDNIRKSFMFILPTSVGEALIIMAAIIMGLEHLPLTPVLILWVNMVTAVTLALALAFEPAEQHVMQRPPRKADAQLLDRFLIWRVVFVAIFMMLGTFGIYSWQIAKHGDVLMARTVAVNTLVFFEIFYLFNARRMIDSVCNVSGLISNRMIWLAIGVLLLLQMGLTYYPGMQHLFGTRAIHLHDWFYVVIIASTVFFAVEAEKWWLRRRHPITAVST